MGRTSRRPLPRLAGTLLVLVVGGAVPGLSPPAARADHEATEARLKSAGVDAALRERIHAAIDRGVRYLLSIEREDGGFVPSAPGGMRTWDPRPPSALASDPGYTALCALALRHAGTLPARLGVRRSARLLFENPDMLEALEGQTYHAGIALMLAMADGGPREAASRLVAALVETQTPAGSWAYGRLGPPVPANLSTSQFGALGLWAGARVGVEVPDRAWRRLAEGQVVSQRRGRWGYTPGSLVGAAYPQGTFMGLANLLLAEAALRRREVPPRTLLEQVTAARERGLAALGEDGPSFLRAFARSGDALTPRQARHATSFPYYTLYALEKACIFADVEEIGGMGWYETGARALLARQREDGAWGPVTVAEAARGAHIDIPIESREVCTAFALLFLLRASEAYHPVTPSPVDGPPARGPVTPSEEAPR